MPCGAVQRSKPGEAFIFEQFEFARAGRETADPSASLGMSKGTVALSFGIGCWINATAGPSTALRSGRDDKFARTGKFR